MQTNTGVKITVEFQDGTKDTIRGNHVLGAILLGNEGETNEVAGIVGGKLSAKDLTYTMTAVIQSFITTLHDMDYEAEEVMNLLELAQSEGLKQFLKGQMGSDHPLIQIGELLEQMAR